jgi:hypothetical protein
MSNNYLFLNNTLYLQQNTDVQTLTINNFDYTFLYNITSLPSMSYLFQNASYQINLSNPSDYRINLTLNDITSYINNQDIVSIKLGESVRSFASLKPENNEKLGDRLLEVVAHKIFGHGQARSAINNDLEFYKYDVVINNHLANTVNNPIFSNEIFNQYLLLGRYETIANNNSEWSEWTNFNFDGLSFDFPLSLYGSIVSSNVPVALSHLLNGPNVGGTSYVNGIYNIPILIKLQVPENNNIALVATFGTITTTSILINFISGTYDTLHIVRTSIYGTVAFDVNFGISNYLDINLMPNTEYTYTITPITNSISGISISLGSKYTLAEIQTFSLTEPTTNNLTFSWYASYTTANISIAVS